MNPEMKENLQDLKDIRQHMYRYYDVGQEYIRQQDVLKRYEKAEERWAPKNKKKMILLSIGSRRIVLVLWKDYCGKTAALPKENRRIKCIIKTI